MGEERKGINEDRLFDILHVWYVFMVCIYVHVHVYMVYIHVHVYKPYIHVHVYKPYIHVQSCIYGLYTCTCI